MVTDCDGRRTFAGVGVGQRGGRLSALRSLAARFFGVALVLAALFRLPVVALAVPCFLVGVRGPGAPANTVS